MRNDCSLGYNEEVGFRAGTCHPFILFDAVAGGEIPVLELPLSLMDSTFYWYMDKFPSEAIGVIDALLGVVERRGGVLVVLWHNNFFDDAFYHEWTGLYGHILDEALKRRAFVGTVAEVSEWWMKRMEDLGYRPGDRRCG